MTIATAALEVPSESVSSAAAAVMMAAIVMMLGYKVTINQQQWKQ